MDLNRLIGMVARIFMRKAINKGIGMATRGGQPAGRRTGASAGGGDMAKRLRQMTRMTRRIGR